MSSKREIVLAATATIVLGSMLWKLTEKLSRIKFDKPPDYSKVEEKDEELPRHLRDVSVQLIYSDCQNGLDYAALRLKVIC